MARYNHFAPVDYEPISFKDVEIGQKVKLAKHKGNRTSYIIITKTGDLSYVELKSKKEHTLFGNNLTVYKISE